MARTLYRIYLYTVGIVLFVFAAFSLGALLNTLFLETGLRGTYENAPQAKDLVQSMVLAVTALVFTLALGGVHYWLIRRDIAHEPGAGSGGVRAFALNLLQAVAALVALVAGANALGGIGAPAYGGVATTLAVAVVALGAFGLVQWERSRAQPAPGAPLVLQRLHLYVVPSALILIAISYMQRAIADAQVVILAAVGALSSPCPEFRSGFPPPPVEAFTCPLPGRLTGDVLAVLWLVGAWLLYAWLAAGDARSTLRAIAHFFGFVVGLVAAIIGVNFAADLVLRAMLGVQPISAADLTTSHDFLPALVIGLALMLGYTALLVRDAPQTVLGRAGTMLTTMTLSAIVLGVPFYWGVIRLVQGVVEVIAPNGSAPTASEWAAAGALLVAGVAHPVLALLVRGRSTATAPTGPRRGYVLAGLAAGALAAAIGAVTAVYLVVTAVLGSPVSADWPMNARQAGSAAIVGVFLAAIHLWRLLTEHKPTPQAAPASSEAGASVAAPHATIEAVLDELLAGRINRNQAATQLRALQQHVEANVKV
jgi:hypothetical protein